MTRRPLYFWICYSLVVRARLGAGESYGANRRGVGSPIGARSPASLLWVEPPMLALPAVVCLRTDVVLPVAVLRAPLADFGLARNRNDLPVRMSGPLPCCSFLRARRIAFMCNGLVRVGNRVLAADLVARDHGQRDEVGGINTPRLEAARCACLPDCFLTRDQAPVTRTLLM